MAFLGFFNVYCMRVDLSVAIVAMVNSSVSHPSNSTGTECPGVLDTPVMGGEFNWDEQTQGVVLSAFFYGYILTQIPGGWLSDKYGGKHFFGGGILVTSVFTLLTPFAAKWHLGALVTVRVLTGFGEGVTFPAMNSMFGKWLPTYETSKYVSFAHAGSSLGTVFAMMVSGVLADSAAGWPSVFYFFGSLGCLWFVAWMHLIHETPADHPRISEEERHYIENSVGRRMYFPIPWKKIVLSPAVWAICASHVAYNWGFFTLLTTLPTYMKNIQKFDTSANGFVSALPYVALATTEICGGFLADLLRKHCLRTVTVRKLLNTFGALGPAILLPCIQLAGCSHTAVVAMLVLTLGMLGFAHAGFNINKLDVSPNFAGVLMGISNGLAGIPGFIGPLVVGALTNNNQTQAQWSKVFYITSGVYLAGAIVFLLWAAGEHEPWNEPEFETIVLPEKENQN